MVDSGGDVHQRTTDRPIANNTLIIREARLKIKQTTIIFIYSSNKLL